MKSLKIWWYKRKARKAYIEYKSICAEYECCGVLTRNISPRAVRQADIFNSAMRELNKIDPSAPFFKI